MAKKKIKSKMKVSKGNTCRGPSNGDKSSKVKKLIRLAKAGKFKKAKKTSNKKISKKAKRR